MTTRRRGQVGRRSFLRTAATAAVGAGVLGPRHGWPQETDDSQPPPPAAPPRRRLGRTGLEVSTISFGGIQIQHERLLDVAIDRGINLVHTAPGYGGGRSIQLFGRVMKRRRDEVFLALKQSPVGGIDRELEALQTDRVDILVPPLQSVAEVDDAGLAEAFLRLKEQGKIRFSGFACHANQPTVIARAVDLGFFDVMLVAYNLANRDELDPLLARAGAEQDMGVMAMKTTKDLRPGDHGAAFRSLLATAAVHTLLVGMSTFGDIEAGVAAVARTTGWLDRLQLREYAHLPATACSFCGACDVCPRGVAVPDILRCGVYLERGERELAAATYGALGGRGLAQCMDCGACEASCPRQRPVRAELRRVHRALA